MFCVLRSHARSVSLLAAVTVISWCLPMGQAQAQESAAAAAPAGKVMVPERTEIKVTLREELKSGASKTGQEVPFTVTQDVYSPDRVLLIAAGTPAYGKVTESKRRGSFGKAGKLNFTCEYVRTADGTRIPLRSDPLGSSGKDNQGAAIATALFVSVLGVFVNGRDVTVPKGKEFTMYVDGNTAVTAPGSAAAPAPASAAPGRSLFLLKDGKEIIGVLASFDGKVYKVTTDNGTETIKAEDVKSVHALASEK